MSLQQVAIVTVCLISGIVVFPDAATVSGRSNSDEAINDGDLSISTAHRRRIDVISPHFPAEGIDYLSGNLAGTIFDMSKTDGNVTLATGISVPRPTSIAWAKSMSILEISDSTSSEMTLEEVSSSIASSYGTQWSGSTPLAKRIGVEVGGSKDATATWARARMTESHKYAVMSKYTYNFVDVTTKPPREADLSEEFLRAFLILPSSNPPHTSSIPPGENPSNPSSKTTSSYTPSASATPSRRVISAPSPAFPPTSSPLIPPVTTIAPSASEGWGTLTDADRGAYARFLERYGTHYVRSAKFGGSYESLVVADACATVKSSKEGSSLNQCASAKLSKIFSGFLEREEDAASLETCQGLTTSGSATGAWQSLSVKSTQLWRGGSFDKTKSLRVEDVGAWIEDIKRNPRSQPTQLNSVPDLFDELLQAYDKGEKFCPSCETLKGFNLDKETFRIMVRNLRSAFEELFKRAKEEKVEREKCKLTCPPCKGKPLEGCTCAKPTPFLCDNTDEDLLLVTVNSIHVDVDDKFFGGGRLRMFTDGLDSPHDGTETVGKGNSVRLNNIGKELQRKKGDFLHIEVISELLGVKSCVGSVNFPFDKVGTGTKIDLSGLCTRSNNKINSGTVGKNGKVRIHGSVVFPNCCTCKDETISSFLDASGSGHGSHFFVLFLPVFLSWIM